MTAKVGVWGLLDNYAERRYIDKNRVAVCVRRLSLRSTRHTWRVASTDGEVVERGETHDALDAMQAADAALAKHTEERAAFADGHSILGTAREAGATDPCLCLTPVKGGRRELRLTIGPHDPVQQIAEALAADDPVGEPRAWVGDEAHGVVVAGRLVVVCLNRRSA